VSWVGSAPAYWVDTTVSSVFRLVASALLTVGFPVG
jgi:hypothetical protein